MKEILSDPVGLLLISPIFFAPFAVILGICRSYKSKTGKVRQRMRFGLWASSIAIGIMAIALGFAETHVMDVSATKETFSKIGQGIADLHWGWKALICFFISGPLFIVSDNVHEQRNTKITKAFWIVSMIAYLGCVLCLLYIPIHWLWYWIFCGALMELFDGFESVLWFIVTIFAMLYVLTLFIRR